MSAPTPRPWRPASIACCHSFCPPTESQALEEHLGAEVAAGALLVTSALATVEVARALRRLGVDDPGGATTTSALAGVAESPISDEVIALARRTGPSVLRSPDALHLATALLLDVDAVLTYDDRLSEAATSVGLAAAAPGAASR